jgi:hypothetical protein
VKPSPKELPGAAAVLLDCNRIVIPEKGTGCTITPEVNDETLPTHF